MIAAEYFGVWDHAPGGPPAYGMYARNVKGLDAYKMYGLNMMSLMQGLLSFLIMYRMPLSMA